MNNKGFTLIEVLATVVIIAVVMGIATTGVIKVINNSKKSSEKVFTDKLATYIESYINLYGSSLSTNTNKTTYTFEKCKKVNDDGSCQEDNPVTSTAYELESFDLIKITKTDPVIISEDKIVNPKNKQKCLTSKNPSVRVFKDSDYIYYYYTDLSGSNTSCDISDDNAIITNIPKKLCKEIKTKTDSNIKCEE